MTAARTAEHTIKRTEILVALIALFGILVTAFLSNWDKIFPKENVVKATYSGYRPTGDFETELRYFFEVSGARVTIESMQKQLLQTAKADLIAQHPDEARRINEIFDAAARESPHLEDVIKELMPVYQKYFSITEIQELNKFYSTDVMQGMTKKIPLLTQDAAPIQVRIVNDFFKRFYERLNTEPKSP